MAIEEGIPDPNVSWDTMRDQDWENLGTVVDLDNEIAYKSLSSGCAVSVSISQSDTQSSMPLSNEVLNDDMDMSWMGVQKQSLTASAGNGETDEPGFEHNSCWSCPPPHRNSKASASPESSDFTYVNTSQDSSNDDTTPCEFEDMPDFDDDSDSSHHQLREGKCFKYSSTPRKCDIRFLDDQPLSNDQEIFPLSKSSAASAICELSLFPLHLFVTAVGDGHIASDTSEKSFSTLEQLKKKVSKEQSTVVQLNKEGNFEVKMRIFALNSVEARALGDYVSSHISQTPAPFVVLARELPMAVLYDRSITNPSQASVADRLRKQIKMHAVKIVRDVLEESSDVDSGALRGRLGAMALAEKVEVALKTRATHEDGDPKKRYIILPSKRRLADDLSFAHQGLRACSSLGKDEAAVAGSGSLSWVASRLSATLAASMPRLVTGGGLRDGAAMSQRSQHHRLGGGWPGVGRLVIPSPRSPDGSAPSTPGTPPSRSGPLDDEDGFVGGVDGYGATACFPVNLFVTAIAEGALARDTPPKVMQRLSQIVRKVPKEQNTSVEVADGGSIDLKMRVFVVNSEDAKAVGEYIALNTNQIPAPFVVLARQLPMAVMYDPASLDLSDASVADRLRKQAKTRAVKVLRESIANRSAGVTEAMLRGHSGALAPGESLHALLLSRMERVDGILGNAAMGAAAGAVAGVGDMADEPRRCILFVARNKSSNSAPSSPRGAASKRGPPSGGGEDHGTPWGPSPVGSPHSSAPPSPSAAGGPASTPPSLAPAGAGAGSPAPAQPFPSPRSRGAVGGSRRTGASSASHLHRDMLDKAFKKVRTLEPAASF